MENCRITTSAMASRRRTRRISPSSIKDCKSPELGISGRRDPKAADSLHAACLKAPAAGSSCSPIRESSIENHKLQWTQWGFYYVTRCRSFCSSDRIDQVTCVTPLCIASSSFP